MPAAQPAGEEFPEGLKLLRKAPVLAEGATAVTEVAPIVACAATLLAAMLVPGFSQGMLLVGHVRRPELPFTAGDALHLPFGDGVFDAATISFGLRNVVDPTTALAELHRVVRPGGRLVICEFSHPRRRLLRKLYSEYLMGTIPPVARAVASNPDAYVYLAESIAAWPDQPALAERIRDAGWSGVEWMNIHGGIVALHRARRA